jgi:hypothetical protein
MEGWVCWFGVVWWVVDVLVLWWVCGVDVRYGAAHKAGLHPTCLKEASRISSRGNKLKRSHL